MTTLQATRSGLEEGDSFLQDSKFENFGLRDFRRPSETTREPISAEAKIIGKIFPDIRLHTLRPARIETEGLNLCLESSRSLIFTLAKKETRIPIVIDVVGEIKSHDDETWSLLS